MIIKAFTGLRVQNGKSLNAKGKDEDTIDNANFPQCRI